MSSTLVRNIPKVEKLPEDYGRHISLLYANPTVQKFVFPGAEAVELEVIEVMAECRIFASVPSAFLQLVSDWLQRRLANIQRISYSIAPTEESSHSSHVKWHRNHLTAYQTALERLRKSPPAYFKPSGRKDEADLQFLPTNLHLQRLMVKATGEPTAKVFDFFTSGCFAAIPLGFKNHSGLLSGQKKLKEQLGAQPNDLQLEMCQLESFRHQLEELRSNLRTLEGFTSEFTPTPNHGDAAAILAKTVKQMRQLLTAMNEICERFELLPVVNELYSLYIGRRLSLCAVRTEQPEISNGHCDNGDVNHQNGTGENNLAPEEICPLDSINSDVDARVMVFATKEEMFNERSRETGELFHWLTDLNSAGLLALNALARLQQSLSDACHYRWLKSFNSPSAIDQFYTVEHRQMVTACQAITAVVRISKRPTGTPKISPFGQRTAPTADAISRPLRSPSGLLLRRAAPQLLCNQLYRPNHLAYGDLTIGSS